MLSHSASLLVRPRSRLHNPRVTLPDSPRSDSDVGWRVVILLILSAAAVYAAILPIQSLWQRATTPWPLTPWESAIVVEAAKAVAGKTPYENPARGGAASHLYGPLTTYATAAVMKLGFYDVRAPRLVSLVCAIAMCGMIGTIFLRLGFKRSPRGEVGKRRIEDTTPPASSAARQRDGTYSTLVQKLLSSVPSLPEFINNLLRTQAYMVAGTEAIAFSIKPGEDGQVQMELMEHIRPDTSTEDVREAAVKEFVNLIKPCIEQQRDGAIKIEGTDDVDGAQFCLVTILRSSGSMMAVSAVIARCRDEQRAKERLIAMQVAGGYTELITKPRGNEEQPTADDIDTGRPSSKASSRTRLVEMALYAVIAASLLIGLHYRGRAYFAEARPDMAGALFATISLLFAYRAWRTEKVGWTIAACVAIAVAFLFKQTYAVAAVFPPVAIVLTDAPRRWRRAVIAGAPFVAVLLTIGVMRFATPNIFHYAISVPQMYHVAGDRVMAAIYAMFMHSPLYLIVAFIYAARRGFDVRREPVVMWLFVATILGSAAGCMAYAKRGGSYNSLLLGWIPMAALTLYALPTIVSLLGSKRTDPVTRLGIAVAMAAALLATNLGVPGSETWGLGKMLADGSRYVTSSANPGWAKMIEVAKTWQGKVVSPTDPTITLFARGEFDRTIDTELDAAGRPKKLPDSIAFYLRDANWFIDASSPYISAHFPGHLESWGFKKVRVDGIDANYAVWYRAEPVAKKPDRKAAKPKRKAAVSTTMPAK